MWCVSPLALKRRPGAALKEAEARVAAATTEDAGARKSRGLFALPRRFARDRRGASALEFALLLAPFFAMVFAILEATMIVFATTTLESGVQQVAREIRTGRAQQQEWTDARFREELCARIDRLLTCDDRLLVDVRAFSGFGAVNPPDPLSPAGELILSPTFEPGDAGDVVLVRVYYRWKVLTPYLGVSFDDVGAGERLMNAAAVFRNEPFEELLASE